MLHSRSIGLIFWRINVRKDYDIVGSYDNQRVSTINAERTVNLFEYDDSNGKRPKSLLPTSGLSNSNLNFTPETGGSRASFVFKGAIYQVFGGSVYRITGNTGSLSSSKIGSLTTSTGYVGVDANTFQVIFVDGVQGWIWDTNANTFTQITDTAFPAKPIDVAFLDGFFIVANGETNNFQLSMLNQGMVWGGGVTGITFTTDPVTDILTMSSVANFRTGTPFMVSGGGLPAPLQSTITYYAIVFPTTSSTTIKVATSYNNAIAGTAIDITTAGAGTHNITSTGQVQLGSITSHPGNIVACKTLHRRLFLFSENYTEVWENAGIGTNLPFRRNNALLMEVGTPAVASVVVGFDRLFFLSQDSDGLGAVMEVRGTESIPVSNRALDYQYAQYASEQTAGITHVADCCGILVKENGLIFYRMNFTKANHTFVLNVSMSTQDSPKWHEEEVLNHNRHPAQTHAFYQGVNYYGSYNQAKFYIVDSNFSTNDGETIRRMRIGKPFAPEGYNRLRIDRFHIDLLQGTVNITVLDEAFLTTEGNETLLTEDGQNILLEQQIQTSAEQPTVFLSYSKDGGQTYGYLQQGKMGKIGERTFRTVWRKLGTIPRGQSFSPKIEFFNHIPFIILGAAWDFEVLPE